jgi:hypothetical protein
VATFAIRVANPAVILVSHTSSTNKELTHVARQQRIDTVFTDDLIGDVLTEDEVQTVTFAVDGTTYEIDLSEKNASSLRNDAAAWVEHARTVTRPKTTGRSTRRSSTGARRPNTDRKRSAKIRQWAHTNGHKVSKRGRIPAAVVDAYNAAH